MFLKRKLKEQLVPETEASNIAYDQEVPPKWNVHGNEPPLMEVVGHGNLAPIAKLPFLLTTADAMQSRLLLIIGDSVAKQVMEALVCSILAAESPSQHELRVIEKQSRLLLSELQQRFNNVSDVRRMHPRDFDSHPHYIDSAFFLPRLNLGLARMDSNRFQYTTLADACLAALRTVRVSGERRSQRPLVILNFGLHMNLDNGAGQAGINPANLSPGDEWLSFFYKRLRKDEDKFQLADCRKLGGNSQFVVLESAPQHFCSEGGLWTEAMRDSARCCAIPETPDCDLATTVANWRNRSVVDSDNVLRISSLSLLLRIVREYTENSMFPVVRQWQALVGTHDYHRSPGDCTHLGLMQIFVSLGVLAKFLHSTPDDISVSVDRSFVETCADRTPKQKIPLGIETQECLDRETGFNITMSDELFARHLALKNAKFNGLRLIQRLVAMRKQQAGGS